MDHVYRTVFDCKNEDERKELIGRINNGQFANYHVATSTANEDIYQLNGTTTFVADTTLPLIIHGREKDVEQTRAEIEKTTKIELVEVDRKFLG